MIKRRGTVHVVDDDAVVRRSLERLLGSVGFSTVLYESATGFLAALPGLERGCVLLDIRMPGMDGFDLLARLNTLGANLPVVVMTAHGEVQTAVRAMKAGAVDFVEKPFDAEYLLVAIENALAVAQRPAWELEASRAVERIAALSPREREVLEHLMAGRPTKIIAYHLGLSVRTVEVHRARMLRRLGVRQIGEVIRIAVMAQLRDVTKNPVNRRFTLRTVD